MTSFPRQCAVYWFDPDPVKGSEIHKVRPWCVVVSPDEMNENLQTVIVVPTTSTIQPWPFRLIINLKGQKSSIACDQIRSIDKSRLRGSLGKLKAGDKERLFSLLQAILSE